MFALVAATVYVTTASRRAAPAAVKPLDLTDPARVQEALRFDPFAPPEVDGSTQAAAEAQSGDAVSADTSANEADEEIEADDAAAPGAEMAAADLVQPDITDMADISARPEDVGTDGPPDGSPGDATAMPGDLPAGPEGAASAEAGGVGTGNGAGGLFAGKGVTALLIGGGVAAAATATVAIVVAEGETTVRSASE
ncbi:MAG TPA: hypothetical protein VNA25_12045 [Phycisphaerae bacterium]|nr:hypothetical protein [Phycisphaerae bacterium]